MGVWDTIKSKVGLGEPEPPPPPPPPPPPLPIAIVQNATHAIGGALEGKVPALTWQQRAIGFGITFGVGILLSFLVSRPRAAGRRAVWRLRPAHLPASGPADGAGGGFSPGDGRRRSTQLAWVRFAAGAAPGAEPASWAPHPLRVYRPCAHATRSPSSPPLLPWPIALSNHRTQNQKPPKTPALSAPSR
jgi:hypothetical protein